MAEYIEREAISKLFDSECRGECVVCPHDDRGDCTLMNQIPSADVQPVKHGRWVFNKPPDDWIMSLYTCDQCGHLEEGKPNYCSHCGAKMDGEDNG